MSKKIIYLDDAIDALKEHRALYCDNTPETFSKLSYVEKSRVDELDTAIATLVNLPSAQPEIDEWCTDCKEYDHEKHCCPRFNKVIRTALQDAQPEIVWCKDCKHWDTTWTNDWGPNYHYCPIIDGVRKDDFYCADAERRTDEQTDRHL